MNAFWTRLTLGVTALAICAGFAAPAGATIVSLSILDGGGTSRTTAWGQDGSSYYFAMSGIYGVNGDYQADVNSSGQLEIAGPVTANAGTNLNTSLLATDAHLTALGTGALATDAHLTTLGTSALGTDAHLTSFTSANHTDLSAINTTLGAPMQASGSTVTVTQATAANLKSQVNVVSGGMASGAVIDLTNIEGVIGNATAPTKMAVGGGVYNSGGVTLTNGQSAALQVTSAGSLHMTADNTNPNGQATMSNSSPVVIASNQSALPVSVASGQIASGAIAAGASAGDPCMFGTKSNLAISTNATSLTQIIAASGSTKIYICSISLIAAGATAFNLNTGTGTNCGTSTAALIGSTTAGNGMSFAANGGLTLGSGSGVIAVTAASSELCTLQSNAVYMSGNLTYVQQ